MKNKELVFDLMHLDKYAIISGPCTVIVQNNSSLKMTDLYSADGHNRWLLKIKAISAFNLALIKDLTNKKIQLTYNDVGHLLMTGALWEDQIDLPEDLPVKGENLIAVFDYVDDILRCTGITLIPRKKVPLFNPAEEFMGQLKEFEQIIKEIND